MSNPNEQQFFTPGFNTNPNSPPQQTLYPQAPQQESSSVNVGGQNFVNFGATQNPNQGLNIDLGQMGGLGGTIASTYGTKFIGAGSDFVTTKYSQSFSLLKYYFNVNNSYVVNKIKLLLFPVRHVYWKRRIHRTSQGEVFLPPRDDINAPDLYIPTMAFITYVLLIGYSLGTALKFTPEVLGITASRAMFALAIEVLLVKFGFYLLSSLTISILDLVSYCGYKFVGIVLTMLAGIVFGSYAFYGTLIVTSIFMAMFMVNTLKLVFPDLGGSGPGAKRKYFLLAVGLLQLFFGYYLSYDIHLS